MTFGGHSEQHHLRPNGARLQMMLRGTQLYMPAKSHVINKSLYYYLQYTRRNLCRSEQNENTTKT